MKSALLLLTALLSLNMPLHAQEEQMRTWTSAKGTTIEGTLLKKSPQSIQLKTKAGKTLNVPINQLSPEDQEYIASSETPAPQTAAAKPAKKGESAPLSRQNFNDPWPKNVRVAIDQEAETIKEEEGEYIYETAHFRFESDAKLSLKLIRNLSCMFEATFAANAALPFSLPCRETLISPKNHKFLAKLYSKRSDYEEIAQMPDSLGIYIPPVIHVPFESLGLKPMGKSYTIDRTGDPSTLIHELTHQMSIEPDKNLPIWFAEGLAQYVESTPYQSGNFNFGLTKKFLFPYILDYSKKTQHGRALGEEFSIMPIQKFIQQKSAQFMAGGHARVNKNYGFAALLVYYFFHIDGNGDAARIKKYVEALQNGQSFRKSEESLLDGRTWEQLQTDVLAGLKKMKVKATIQEEREIVSY